jgi:signal transduction histidine kinase
MKSLLQILEQFQKLLRVNQTLDYYSQNSISSSQIILNLIEDLLSLAKINKNVFEINTDPEINLIEVVQEAFQVISFNAEAK